MVQTTSNNSLRGAHAPSLYSVATTLEPRVIEGTAPNCPSSTPRGVPALDITCGPLLRYVGMNDIAPNTWRGSIMIVTRDDSSDYSRDPAVALAVATGEDQPRLSEVPAKAIHKEQGLTFWRFDLAIAMTEVQQSVSYMINNDDQGRYTFFVPAGDETMNVMFYSCNGFSYGVDTSEFSGRMWNDVLQHHQERPFHVMLGGGDQIYCDAIKAVSPTVKKWASEKNPLKKGRIPFNDAVKAEINSFFLWHYIQWYGFGYWEGAKGSTEQVDLPRAMAQIPMINVFDDHDIIDGFGSYHDHTMRIPVFNGVGNCAFKYYLLFQHQLSPSESVANEPAYILSPKEGPYIHQQARSLYARLGRSLAFYGLDCRTERSHHEVVTPAHYQQMFDRLRREVGDSQGQIKHVLVMLGVPIAYPRMVWLENILTSKVMEPVKALAKHGGFFKGMMNEFDGSIEILDDLDDHWCAKHHKKERNWLVKELQKFAAETKVRITVLSGDVHLAGIGRFYSKHRPPAEQDPNLMLNIISSAIVNTPPPNKLADFLNKRNKIHHLTREIDEDMVKIFTHDVDGKKRNNMRLLPRRNWCSIAQQADRSQHSARRAGPLFSTENNNSDNEDEPAYTDGEDSLSIVIHVEKDQHVDSGETVPYEILVPTLS